MPTMKFHNILPAVLLLSARSAIGETSHRFLRRLEESSDGSESVDDCGRPAECPEEFCVGNSNGRCGPGKGSCFEAVETFLLDPDNTTVAISASAKLKYGKYCGRDNRCSDLEGCDDAPLPCSDAVDAACMIHDTCLDNAIKKFEDNSDDTCFDGEDNDIPFVERLTCDATFVATLAGIATTATKPTGLCDEAYYTMPAGDSLVPVALVLGHEAVLMAAPFCTTTIEGCTSTIPACQVATPFCDAFKGKLAEILN